MANDVDVLGPGWTVTTLPLRPDGGTPDPVATLVRRVAAPSRRAVLYVHGFVDYFFQTHVGDALVGAGYDFAALDLRDFGRSIRPGRRPNAPTDLGALAEEIDAAVRLLRADHDQVVLMAHSMGGLVASLWADARPGVVDAVVLNSPWLDLRANWFERAVAAPLIDVVGRFAPSLRAARLGKHYGEALHAEWGYDLAWKPIEGFPVTAGFIRAVRRGHARVARGLAIDVPVLVLASDATGPDDRWHEELLTTDSVLDVAHIASRAVRLGSDVTFVEVPGGAHDLALSPSPTRERYLDEVLRFLAGHLEQD
ncbi:alpha/beta hydrolase [Cellulomonas edaphi]|uniref:Alpha/beta hydrolase n=1 Tax=Cellulomonas edaphi TaxID=3053468 RepID=A0ABT7S3X2_9CELL|nr:alpha/beta hydrolase [Cellulomons edaphi]MDM7830328.1 alpha/beta hydrolase [Cellulomons edaphi]